MPFARPSLASLIARVTGDIRGRLEIVGPLLRRAMADVLGKVWGGTAHELYGFLDWLKDQLFGDTADEDMLLRLAAMYGITPSPATFFTCTLDVTGTPGTPVPLGTIYRLDAVNSYSVTVGQTISGGGTATVPIVAVLAGAASNVPAGTEIDLESPIAGVNTPAFVSVGSISVVGADAETIDSIRTRYLLRLREPPEGGANQDYVEWTLAAGVGATRAWTFPNELGLGTVVVRFVEDNNIVSIFPGGGDVATVQAALNAQRPITAAVTAVAPTNLAVPFTVHLVPSTTATQAAVAAELADLFTREGAPGDGAGQGTILLSQILTAIGTADGVTDFTLTLPAANVVPTLGQLATVGAITWV